jgi:iron complex transport system substrate-binding protein
MPTRRAVLTNGLALALSACTRKRSDADAGGPPSRIVSLSPSTTEALFAVGAGPQLVGRSRYCDYPPEVLALPQVGGYVDPSFEAILALRPDLVVGARGPAGSAIADRLGQKGIATFFPETESLAAIDAMLRGLGDRTGHAAAGAAAAVALDGRVAKVEAAVAGVPKTRVLLVFGLAPLSVAGPLSFAEELIRRAGGINVVTEGGAYPTIGVERVLRLDPDVVVNAAMMEERASERIGKGAPGWDKVRAVESGRLVSITDEALLRPGPRIDHGLALLARALHPDAPGLVEGGAP